MTAKGICPDEVIQLPVSELSDMLKARDWFEGNPEGALCEIEHRVKRLLDGIGVGPDKAIT